MPGMSEALRAFLRARLDEEEAAARAAPGEHWRAFKESDVAGASVFDEQWALLYPARYDHDEPMSSKAGATGPQYIQFRRDQLAAHVARNDPARVLAEIKVWRRVLLSYATLGLDAKYAGTERETGFRLALSATLKAKAAMYADHPDYAPERWPSRLVP